MADKKFTEIQPKHGERIVHCGHLHADKHHFFKMQDGKVRFMRPDRTMGEAGWVVACDACWRAAKGNPKAILIRGDGTWKGNAPAVCQVEDSGTVYDSKPPDPNNN